MRHSKIRFRLMYLIALGIIASLVLAMKFQLGSTLSQMEDDSQVINLAGRQRMLSQRIASKSLLLSSALIDRDETKIRATSKLLSADLLLWMDSHNGLLMRDAEAGLSGFNTPEVVDLFEDLTPAFLQVQLLVRALLEQAELPVEERVSSDEIHLLAEQVGVEADYFLPIMHQIVGAYGEESGDRVEALQAEEQWLSGIILVVLFLETILLFEPMLRKQEKAVRQIQDAMDKANQASQIKSEFLANMSHEIRTPMAAILGYTDLLKQEDQSPEKAREHIETIERNGNHLLSIINDVLDMSKIEAGQMAVELIEMSPAQIAEEAVSLIRPKIQKTQLKLSINYVNAIPEAIRSDPTRLRQILINLVGNAIKFTKQGGITLEVDCDWQKQQMIFRIIDTGIGMTPQQRDRIAAFKPFTQADTSMTRKYGGTGLGLRISNILASMLGGGIQVESMEGEGSTFIVTINAGDLRGVKRIKPDQIDALIREHKKQAKAIKNQRDTSLKGMRVLVVEDGKDNQRLIEFHLKKAGAQVAFADNGRIGVDYLQDVEPDQQPHIVLMDMQMPEMDGYSATRLLRKRGSSLPIVALTAHAMEGDRELCIEAGCDEYLTKPIDKEKLKLICTRLTSWSAAA